LHVALSASRSYTQDLIERITTAVTVRTVAIRAMHCDLPDQGLHRARYRRTRPEEIRTRGTLQGFAPPFLLVRMLDKGLGDATGELLAQGPDRLTDLRERRCGRGQLGFDLIKPLVKPFVELLA
jgi:hypothetical protein